MRMGRLMEIGACLGDFLLAERRKRSLFVLGDFNIKMEPKCQSVYGSILAGGLLCKITNHAPFRKTSSEPELVLHDTQAEGGRCLSRRCFWPSACPNGHGVLTFDSR